MPSRKPKPEPLKNLSSGQRAEIREKGGITHRGYAYRTRRGPDGVSGYRAMKKGRPSGKGFAGKKLSGPKVERPVAYYGKLGGSRKMTKH